MIGDYDFRIQLTREKFEEWCDDLLKRVPGPVLKALEADGLTMANISAVEIVGGGVRVPKVQAVLKYVLVLNDLTCILTLHFLPLPPTTPTFL